MKLLTALILVGVAASAQLRAETAEDVGSPVMASLLAESEFIWLTIYNPQATEARIYDIELDNPPWPPRGLDVRLRDASGEIMKPDGGDAGGWWNSGRLRSQLSPLDEPPPILGPGETISEVVPIGDVLGGIGRSTQPVGDACHYQARFRLYSADTSEILESHESDWVAVSCASALGY